MSIAYFGFELRVQCQRSRSWPCGVRDRANYRKPLSASINYPARTARINPPNRKEGDLGSLRRVANQLEPLTRARPGFVGVWKTGPTPM